MIEHIPEGKYCPGNSEAEEPFDIRELNVLLRAMDSKRVNPTNDTQ